MYFHLNGTEDKCNRAAKDGADSSSNDRGYVMMYE